MSYKQEIEWLKNNAIQMEIKNVAISSFGETLQTETFRKKQSTTTKLIADIVIGDNIFKVKKTDIEEKEQIKTDEESEWLENVNYKKNICEYVLGHEFSGSVSTVIDGKTNIEREADHIISTFVNKISNFIAIKKDFFKENSEQYLDNIEKIKTDLVNENKLLSTEKSELIQNQDILQKEHDSKEDPVDILKLSDIHTELDFFLIQLNHDFERYTEVGEESSLYVTDSLKSFQAACPKTDEFNNLFKEVFKLNRKMKKALDCDDFNKLFEQIKENVRCIYKKSELFVTENCNMKKFTKSSEDRIKEINELSHDNLLKILKLSEKAISFNKERIFLTRTAPSQIFESCILQEKMQGKMINEKKQCELNTALLNASNPVRFINFLEKLASEPQDNLVYFAMKNGSEKIDKIIEHQFKHNNDYEYNA